MSDPPGSIDGPILAIETSCDETCAAVVDGVRVRSSVISSQADLHAEFGGVVPEVASRRHVELIDPVIGRALEEAGIELDDLAAVAVTRGPGLIGALLVGLATAKGIAAARSLPLVPVDHLHGHVAACYLEPDPLEPPFLCLIASGGHTLLAGIEDHGPIGRPDGGNPILGQTLDDAAGEAFDKGARLLGLGYPGGLAVDRLADRGDPRAFAFPIAMPASLDFSFSGVKTSLVYTVGDLGDGVGERLADLCASYRHAIVEALARTIELALEDRSWAAVALGGGVAANSELRRRVGAMCTERGLRLELPPLSLCTDNAAMIGAAAYHAPCLSYPDYLSEGAVATGGAGA